jgi:hypothetical protein
MLRSIERNLMFLARYGRMDPSSTEDQDAARIRLWCDLLAEIIGEEQKRDPVSNLTELIAGG